MLALCLLSPFAALADKRKKKNQPTTGRIEVSTNPGGYPIFIDGQPAGETTEYVRVIELPSGEHTVDIAFPNDVRWSHRLAAVAGRKDCIALTYRPRTITIPATVGGDTPAAAGLVETVDVGDVTGTVCDCGEIPAIPKVPWWKRAAKKAAGKK